MPDHAHNLILQAIFNDLVPAHNGFPIFLYHLLHSGIEIYLQLFFIFQVQFLFTFLAIRTGLPAIVPRFITPNMNVPGREKRKCFCKYVSQKIKSGFLAHAIQFPADGMLGLYNILFTCTAQMRIGRNSRQYMCRKFNLGNDIYIAGSGISHYFLNVFLGIIAALTFGAHTAPCTNRR
ncbi:hypothetical protein D3C86_1552110 [compost metagenome]